VKVRVRGRGSVLERGVLVLPVAKDIHALARVVFRGATQSRDEVDAHERGHDTVNKEVQLEPAEVVGPRQGVRVGSHEE
jgi:hypothetical protein